MSAQRQPHIVVVGGGFGGLESAFYLRMRLHDKARITLVSDQDYFLFKPNTIYIPFGLPVDKLMIPLQRPAQRRHIEFVQTHIREVDPITRTVSGNGTRLSYDFLVIATGAGMRPEEVSGLAEYAQTIWTPADMLRLRGAYSTLLADVQEGKRRHVLFLIPPNNKCAGPLYEMVLMLDTWLRRQRVRKMVDIVWSTYEASYIQAFGPRLDEVITKEFEKRGISGYKNYTVKEVERGGVIYSNGQSLAYDLLISFPPYVASTPFPELPSDDRGFIITDPASRQVVDYPEIYAVGDASDFPVKQAFLALLQADAAAAHVTSRVLGVSSAIDFEPISMCIMEQFDKATFAQVPLRLTGNPEQPVAVQPDADGVYRVGSSLFWRPGKKLLGIYLPWRFKAGNPFHAGLPWKGMEVGLKVMSTVLAR
jgi:sulfide:quinone oxidoreductase